MFNLSGLYFVFYWHIRSLIKWVLRKTTKLCELQRICYGKQVGCPRSSAVEFSLFSSKSEHIKNMIKVLNDSAANRQLGGRNQKLILERSVKTVIIVKKINPDVHRQFVKSFTRCLEHIWGYKQLYAEVEELRLTQYDSSCPEHEEKLQRLWTALCPETPLEARITKQWQDIGFQGDDPKTDFRGMGLLGLENLLFFAEEYSNAAKHVLLHSLHPKYGYAFAIVGINLTSLAYHILKDGAAKTHIYNIAKSMPSMRVFHQFYCYLFYEFDRFWIEAKPQDVMQFSFIKDQFEESIRRLLENPMTTFNINFVVNTV
ncbi:ELMO domain-containing protein 2 [Cimex lectularius]|uniref:ELMO domain-containing protein n=1 Tax=Cimex lectularius TaxID=79782 RepID=A0A8I6TGA8_CIMLE|nr:ELMO domain-containing protein 2 [Cimex lectularius]